jgi:ABC-type nitrate/sulfonate/bicarbonate transport system substrate-binding protein
MRFVMTLAVIAVLLVGCTSASTGNAPSAGAPSASAGVASATADPAAAFKGTTIKVAKLSGTAVDDAAIGYWQKAMSDKYGVSIKFEFTSATDVSLRAVVSNADDMAVSLSLTDLVHLVQQSSTDVKLIAADTYASDYQLVAKSSIASVADLKGKTQGISAPGDASELVMHLCLNAQGVDYSSLKIVRIGGTSARVAALLAGQIDFGAAHIADATAAVAKSNGALKILSDCGRAVGNYPVTGMITTGAWLKANPKLAQLVVDGYIDAMRWASTNKDQFVTFAKTWVPDANPDTLAPAWDYFKAVGFWPVNGGVDVPAVETYIGYAAQLGVLTGKIPTTDLWVDDSFVNNYLARNGKK